MQSSWNCGPVLVVDDDAPSRSLVTETLAAAGLDAVEAATGAAALAVARGERPGAVVLDVNLPDVSGWEVCRSLREQWGPRLPIVFLSGHRTEAQDRVAGLLLGADDYLVKPYAPDELMARLRPLIRRSAADGTLAPLTPRELEVLRLLAEGLEPPAIAARLVISPKTVRTHVERILGKLSVHSRAQAVAVAYRAGLVAE